MNNELELANVIQALRENLEQAMLDGIRENIRFNITNIDVELQTVVKKAGEVSGKAEFWVVEGGAKGSYDQSAIQKIKLSLQPVEITPDGEEKNMQLSGED